MSSHAPTLSPAAKANIPTHIAIIMDGNGRWAQQRGLPRIAGHEAGSKSIERCVQACLDTGVQYLTLYAFSSENWKRPAAEVNALMFLLEKFLNQKRDEMVREGIRLHHIGRIQELPSVCQRKLREVMEATASNTRLHLVLALSYSGRAEIVDAVKSLVRDAAAGTVRETGHAQRPVAVSPVAQAVEERLKVRVAICRPQAIAGRR
mgnify:CR=1 FL=1